MLHFLSSTVLSLLLCYLIFSNLAQSQHSRININQLRKQSTIFYTTYNKKKILPKPQKKIQKTKKKQAQKQEKKIIPKKEKTSSPIIKKNPQTQETSPVKDITELTQAANIIRPVIPKYPEIAQKAGIEATVILEIIVDEKGNVAHSNILHCSQPGYKFEKNAQNAANELKFKPFLQDNKPIKVKLIYPIQFVLIE